MKAKNVVECFMILLLTYINIFHILYDRLLCIKRILIQHTKCHRYDVRIERQKGANSVAILLIIDSLYYNILAIQLSKD